MTPALLTALIVVMTNGNVGVTENLSPERCKEAACLAEWGKTCVEHAVETLASDIRYLAYIDLGPAKVKACEVERMRQIVFSFRCHPEMNTPQRLPDVRLVRCVK